jgi:hypothetical protein
MIFDGSARPEDSSRFPMVVSSDPAVSQILFSLVRSSHPSAVGDYDIDLYSAKSDSDNG